MLDKIYMTNHAIDRAFERFPKMVSEKKLRRGEINMKTQKKSRIWQDLFVPMLSECTENRTFMNNTRMMVNFYERYGYDSRFKFLDNVEQRARFVLREREDGNWIVVTVMEMEYQKIRQNVKYNTPKNTIGSKMKACEVEIEVSAHVHAMPINAQISVEPSTQKKGKTKQVKTLWTNAGRVRDEDGYLMTDEEQITKAGIELPLPIIDIKRIMSSKTTHEDLMAVPKGADSYYHLTKYFRGYLIDYKVIALKSLSSMVVESIRKISYSVD